MPNVGKEVEPYLEILDGETFDVLWTNNSKYKGNESGRVAIVPGGALEIHTVKPGENYEIRIFGDNNAVEFCGDLFFRIYN
jgi:hypothetical protein